LYAHGIKLAIASSSKAAWIKNHSKYIGHLNISSLLRRLTTMTWRMESLTRVYIKALEQIESSIGNTLAIEDSTNGTRAAKSAGLICIGLNVDGFNLQDLSMTDTIIRTYDDLLGIFIKMLN